MEEFAIAVNGSPVSAVLMRPVDAAWLLVLAHGAGAGMRQPFMEAVAGALAKRAVATMRYQFPYMEAGRKRPDRPAVAQATVRAAVSAAAGRAPDLPLLAGGKSFGGRMTSQAVADGRLPGVRGLVFFGFPLHAAGRPSDERAAHLYDVGVPMLFLQGTRDALAHLDLLAPVCERLAARDAGRGPADAPVRTGGSGAGSRDASAGPGVALATLHVVEGADHSFHVLKRSGRTDGEVLDELADAVAGWAATL
jgi:predicted alpha/beta-hydrolase family hydrolase